MKTFTSKEKDAYNYCVANPCRIMKMGPTIAISCEITVIK